MINVGAINSLALNAIPAVVPVQADAPAAISALLFAAYVEGAPDGLADYPMRLTSMQVTRKTRVPSYYSMVVQYLADEVDAINARLNGQCVIQSWPVLADGTQGTATEFDRFNVGQVRPSKGSRSASIVITGSRQKTYSSPNRYTLTDADLVDWSIDSSDRIKITTTPAFAQAINPGDTVNYGVVSARVSEIQLSVGAGSFSAALVGDLI